MFRAIITFDILLFVTCVLIHLPDFRCHTMNDSRTLLTTILADYDKTFRPVANQSESVGLSVGLELLSIHEFDEVQEKLTIAAVMSLTWIDEYINWNPDDYGGMHQLVIENDKVWTPPIVLVNNVKKLEKIGDSWQVIRFTSDGIAAYYPGDVLAASCTVDITYYPWDKHRCIFSFSAWAHSAAEIYFHPSSDKVQKHYFSENGVWDFVDSGVYTTNDNQYLNFYLHIERKPRFIVVNIIIPIVCLAFLNSFIFLIPTASGERISYGITVLLAIAVFLTLVGDNLPKSSSPMSIFGYYLMTVLIISIFITLVNILSLRLYFRGDSEPVTGCWTGLVRCMKCKRPRRKIKTNDKGRNSDNRDRNNDDKRTESNDIQQGYHPFNVFPKTDRERVTSVYESSVHGGGNHKYHERNGRPIRYTHDDDNYLQPADRETQPANRGTQSACRENDKQPRQTIPPNVLDTHTNITWKDVSAAMDISLFIISISALTSATIVYFSFIFGYRE